MVRKLGVALLGALLVCAGSVNNGFAAEKILKVGVGDAIDSDAGVFTRKFKEIVEADRPDIKIVLVDERLTTVEAYENLRKGGMKASKKELYVDSESAAIILESYLNGKGETHA